MIKKLWGDPVWSKVFAWGIIGLIASVITYAFSLWPVIVGYLEVTWAFATERTEVANWLLGTLGLCAIVVLVLACTIIWGSIFGDKGEGWESYREDEFFGIRWRWRYGNGPSEIYDLCAYCPTCDMEVHPRNASAFRAIDHIEYHCDHCGNTMRGLQMSEPKVRNRVTREIHRKIRTGELRGA